MLDTYIAVGLAGLVTGLALHAATQPDPRVDLAPSTWPMPQPVVRARQGWRARLGWSLWVLWCAITGGKSRW